MRFSRYIPTFALLILFALSLARGTIFLPAPAQDKEEAQEAPDASMPAPLVSQQKLSEHVARVGADSLAGAKDALAQFEELISETNFEKFGFDKLQEVKKCELGHPLPVLMVRLDDLRKYRVGDDPVKLLCPLKKVVYPVLVDGKVRSGVVLREDNGVWQPSTFGISNSVRLFSEAREKHAGRPGDGDYFLLKVHALNHVYLGHRKDAELRLVAVRDQAAADHKLKGQPAAELFVELAKLAKEHDGTPR